MTPEGRVLAQTKRSARDIGLRFIRLSMSRGVEVGWPDVIILGPCGGVLWVETKAPGKPLRPIQNRRRDEIEIRGGEYVKVDSVEMVEETLQAFLSRCLMRRFG